MIVFEDHGVIMVVKGLTWLIGRMQLDVRLDGFVIGEM